MHESLSNKILCLAWPGPAWPGWFSSTRSSVAKPKCAVGSLYARADTDFGLPASRVGVGVQPPFIDRRPGVNEGEDVFEFNMLVRPCPSLRFPPCHRLTTTCSSSRQTPHCCIGPTVADITVLPTSKTHFGWPTYLSHDL